MFTASVNHPARFHQERRQRRGSLPLKKRRVCLDLDLGSANAASPFFTYKPASGSSLKQEHQIQHPAQVQQQQQVTSDFTTTSGHGHHQHHHHHHHLALLSTQSLLCPTADGGQHQQSLKFQGSDNGSASNANDTTKLAALSFIAAAAASAAAQQAPAFQQQQPQLPFLSSQNGSGGAKEDEDDESSSKDYSSSDSDSSSDDDEEEQELILSNSKPNVVVAAASTITSRDNNNTTNKQTKVRTSTSSCHYKNCKRLAGFRGSDYCKLHLLQVKKIEVNSKTKISINKKSLSSNNSKQSSKTTSTTTATPAAAATNTSGQDKRYTGVELRCCATTTRGRACAYIAVGTTKYCYMHADYDTNPPPRRGLKSPTPTTAIVTAAAAAPPSPKKASTSSSTSSSSGSTSTSKIRSSNSNSKTSSKAAPPAPPAAVARRSSAKRAEKHADSPYPLLSMLSTDQWYQRKVQVAVGPLQGRVGSVQKWGNGWISVKIPGVAGLHNRRSFELYLQDVDDNSNSSGSETTKKSQDRAHSASSSSKKRKAKAAPAAAAAAAVDPEAESMGLFRCVSRDVDVVSPSPSTDHSIRSARSFTPKLTSSGSSSSGTRAGKFSPAPETPTPLLAGRTSSFLTPVPQKAAAAPPKGTPLLNDGAKPVVSLKSSCDRLQLPVTTTGETSKSKSMVFRPTAAAASSTN